MTTTPNFGLTLLEAAQAQKEATINEAFAVLDVFLKGSVLDKDLATPPTSPAAGAAYIVAASPTGAWAGQAKAIAYFDQIWHFIAPRSGMRVRVSDEHVYYEYDGSGWVMDGGVASYTDLTVTNPITGSVSGNAATATKLATARTINGVAFDGTANITVGGDLTGEVTTAGSVATLSNSAVIGKVLTGFTSGAGTVTSSDSLL